MVARRNGRTVLIGYTPRRSRPGLIAAMRKHGEELVEFLRPGEHDSILLDGYPPYFVIGEWRIGFSGRTQARAKQEGELRSFSICRRSHRAVHPRGRRDDCPAANRRGNP